MRNLKWTPRWALTWPEVLLVDTSCRNPQKDSIGTVGTVGTMKIMGETIIQNVLDGLVCLFGKCRFQWVQQQLSGSYSSSGRSRTRQKVSPKSPCLKTEGCQRACGMFDDFGIFFWKIYVFVSWASWDNYSQYIPIYGKIKCYKPTTSFGILSHPQIKWSTLGTFDNWSWDTIFSSKGRQNQPWNTNLPKPWRRESMLGYEMELPRNVSDQQETTLLEEGHTQRMCCFPETRGTWSWQFHHQNLNGGSQRFFYYPLK